MSDTNAYIRDHRSLIELNNTLGYSADSILKLLDSVKSYMEGVQDVLAKQVEYLAHELEDAEQALAEAEEDLSSCEASQEWDEEEHEYYPSCSSESQAVARAREVRDECKQKYDEGCRINDECKQEIELYKKDGGILSPPGGEKLLEYLAVEHTDSATNKMQEILDTVEDYTRTRVTTRESSGNSSDSAASEVSRPSEDRPLADEEKEDRFKNAIRNVIERQQDQNYGDRMIADANRAMKCPRCARPMAACVCGIDDRLKGNIQIINDDFSR